MRQVSEVIFDFLKIDVIIERILGLELRRERVITEPLLNRSTDIDSVGCDSNVIYNERDEVRLAV